MREKSVVVKFAIKDRLFLGTVREKQILNHFSKPGKYATFGHYTDYQGKLTGGITVESYSEF